MGYGSKKATTCGAPASVTAETIQLASKTNRFPYTRPTIFFLPTVILVMLFTYLAVGVEVDASGEHLVLPDYVRDAAMHRDMAAGRNSTEPIPFNAFLFFEESIMGLMFRLGLLVFGGLPGVRVACTIAWLIHFYELGVSFRICRSSNASVPVTACYMCCTFLGGLTQLLPLRKARDAWMNKVRATATNTPAVTAESNSKKNL
ncbi:hypothetical protein JKF63_05075 [Porcisia hertigi]|uniref:Uncharacterized protein n=1 Tax=Porcisia hertigi TaxID=2761500 RepID=A0A836I5X0_9TRYP|nr:hypothetical protein JKF63_05075 [Porcisia hertigi]